MLLASKTMVWLPGCWDMTGGFACTLQLGDLAWSPLSPAELQSPWVHVEFVFQGGDGVTADICEGLSEPSPWG